MMGREIRRVPLDFDWPRDKVWPGFYVAIPECPNDCEWPTQCTYCKAAWEHSLHGPSWEIKPPAGDGWQLWETVSEGSPISPVFTTPEELARWMVSGRSAWMMPTDYDAALRFITGSGWAPSMVFTPKTGFVDGVTFEGRQS